MLLRPTSSNPCLNQLSVLTSEGFSLGGTPARLSLGCTTPASAYPTRGR